MKILLIDDDEKLCRLIRAYLEPMGFTVEVAHSGKVGLEIALKGLFDAILLDIMLPEIDGFEILRQLRQHSRVPILMFTARGDETDRIVGLEMGADDYLPKTFSSRELLARVKAGLRRMQARQEPAPQNSELIKHGMLEIDLARHRCLWGAKEIVFTVTEFSLLETLIRSPGRVYSRDQLVDKAYGDGHVISDRTVDSHIRRIRKKLDSAGADIIETVYGLGYRAKETP
ncbi:response regulator transcription factor [Myxococcota bacterium]|nr:response regulator transcription factor [Myxococcota bacterium]